MVGDTKIPSFEELPLQDAETVYVVCQQFEDALAQKPPPRIEQWVEGHAEPVRSVLVYELADIEIQHRLKSNEQAVKYDLLTRFPHYKGILTNLFEAALQSVYHVTQNKQQADTIAWLETQGRSREQVVFRIGDDYDALEAIASGGMGTVYKARHISSGQFVALKMIRKDFFDSEEAAKQFEVEIRALMVLKHPCIVRLYHCGQYNGQLYFTMELLDNESLVHWMEEKAPIDPKKAIRLLIKVSQGIAAAHASSPPLLHLDLSSNNILFDQQREPQVIDFGLSKQFGQRRDWETDGNPVGTLLYMAPEIMRGDWDAVGPQADVYSLGVLLYEVLAGHRPFQSSNAQELRRQVQHDPVRPLREGDRNIPADLETVVLKCLEKKPKDRYVDATQLTDRLQKFLNGENIPEHPYGIVEKHIRWYWQHPISALTRGLLVVLGILIVVGFVSVWQRFQIAQKDAQVAQEENKAKAEKIRRLEKEKQLADTKRQAIHDKLVDNARGAANAGNWRVALDWYDAAIADQLPDANHLSVLRLRCLFALNRQKRLESEIARLEKLPKKALNPSAQAALWLVQGEWALTDPAQIEKGTLDLRNALIFRKSLSKGNTLYAEALLATRPRELVGKLEEALRHSPSHHSSNRTLLFVRIMRGELKKAKKQLREFRLLYPHDPASDVAAGLIDALELNRKSIPDKLAPLDKKLGKERRKHVEKYLLQFAEILAIMNRPILDQQQGRFTPKEEERLTALFLTMQKLQSPIFRPIGVPVASQQLLKGFAQELDHARRFFATAPLQLCAIRSVEIQRLENLHEDYPEAMFLHLAILYRFMNATAHVVWDEQFPNPKNITALKEESRKILQLIERAENAPTLLRNPSIPFQSKLIACVAAISLLNTTDKVDAEFINTLRTRMDTVVPMCKEWPKLRAKGLGLLAQMIPMKPSPSMLEQWKLDTVEGEQRYLERKQLIAKLGRRFFTQWFQDDPQNSIPAVRIALAEAWAENYGSAYDAAQRARRLAPKDAHLRDVFQKTKEALRKQLGDGKSK